MLLEKILERVSPVLIGLWRFRYHKHSQGMWCCTWRYRGLYYDTYPRKKPEDALNAVWRNWQEVKRRKKTPVRRRSTPGRSD